MSKSDTPPPCGADQMLRLTSEIVAAYVSCNELAVGEIPAVIRSVHDALGTLASSELHAAQHKQEPAVPISSSVTPDYVVCLEDGKKLKMLKRYLRTHYELTPDEYRERWGLPPDYPMVAPNYAAQRSEYAKKIGLGQSAGKRGKRGPRKAEA